MSNDLFGTTGSGADFSEDRLHRLRLWRIWDNTKPFVMFIGLNPSTANEEDSDPTITRVKNFATSWGYGGVYMMNLFSFVTPYPAMLKLTPQKILNQEQNFANIEEVGKKCTMVVFAWGGFKEAKEPAAEIINRFPYGMCLGQNSDGSPKHPLYLKSTLHPVKFIAK